MKLRLTIFWVMLILVLPRVGLAQGAFVVRNFDARQFPVLQADIIAFDADGNLLKDLSPIDIQITEKNGTVRHAESVICAPDDEPRPLSSVLVVDISAGMNKGNAINIARSASAEWIAGISVDSSEAAVTGFDNLNYIYHDLTNDTGKLLKAVDELEPNSGSRDYDAAFLKAPAGGFSIAARGVHKRILVLITNGNGGGSEKEIIAAAQKNNVSVYIIGVNFSLPDVLKNIARNTGGEWFENIQTENDAKIAARQILALARGGKPCHIMWETEANCFKDQSVRIGMISTIEADTINFTAPFLRSARLVVSPSGVDAGRVQPLLLKDTNITIRAENGDIQISDILSSNAAFTILNSPKDFLLKSGDSAIINIRFSPSDSALAFSEITFKTDACSPVKAYIRGGFSEKTTSKLLKVISPNGGERIPSNAITTIEWTGVLPQDTVRIEYSADGGISWKIIQDSATGLRYDWKTPDTVSTRVLVRVQHVNGDANTWRPVTVINLKDEVQRAILSPDGKRVLTLTLNSRTAEMWDADNGSKLFLLPRVERISAIAYSRSGRYIATTFTDTAAYNLYSAADGTLYRTSGTSQGLTTFTSVDIHPQDSSIILGEKNGDIYLQQIFIPFAPFRIIPGTFFLPVHSVRYSGDGRSFVASGESKDIYSVDNNLVNNAVLKAKLQDPRADIYSYGAAINFDGSAIIASLSLKKQVNGQEMPDINPVLWEISGDSLRLVRSFKMPRGVAYTNRFSWDNQLLVVGEAFDNLGSINNTYVFNVASGALVATLSQHTSIVRDACFSADGRRIVTASSDKSVIIWEKSPIPDTSDAFFTISGPQVASQDVDLGKVIVNITKDSTAISFLCNTSAAPLAIDSVSITSGDKFSATGNRNFSLEPNACYPVDFRFAPPAEGIFTDTIRIFTADGIIRRIVRGEGIKPEIEIVNLVDFGRVFVGNTKDSIIQFSISNKSTAAISISDTKIAGPDTTQFSIISGGGAFILSPNESHVLKLRFLPQFIGRFSSGISFIFKNGTAQSQMSQSVLQLFGEGICAGNGGNPARIQFAETGITTRTGQLLKLPLKVIPPQNSLQNVPRGFTTDIRFNKSILFPVFPTPKGRIDGNDRIITLTGKRNDTSDVLADLIFSTALGDTDRMLLKIENFQWENCGGDAEAFATEIMIENICETDSAKRFFTDTDLPEISITPSIFGDEAEIRYLLIETGQTEIFIMDILGRKIAVLLKENALPGEVTQTFDARDIAAGMYFIVLKTPTQTITQRIEKLR
ncbi:MAG: choice-of-anchor D domain-containing protein [Bacteroidota bacterium]